MASIRPHRKGFMVDARITGERRRQVVASEEAAEALLRSWGVPKEAGDSEGLQAASLARRQGPTLEEVATEYLLWQEANLRPASVTATKESLAALRRAAPGLLSCDAMALTPSDIRRLKLALSQGRAVATVNKDLTRFRAMLNWAARAPEGDGRREGGGLLPRVAVYVRPPRVPRPSPATVAPRLVDETLMRALFASARDPRLRLALALARYCGLRRSEVLRLRLADLDLDGGVVRVLGPTKGHRPRLAPLGPRGSDEARRYLAVYPVAPGKRSGEMLLFPGWTVRAVTQQVRRLGRRVGWKTAKPGLHSLRATWCSELLGRGAPLHAVQEAGGWASLAAMQHYAGAATEAINRLARFC
jgi:integrase